MFFEIGYNVGLVLTNRAKKSQIFSLWPLCFLRNIHVFGCTFLVFYIPESSDPKYCARIACFRRLDGGDGTKRGPRSSSYHKRATVLWKKNRSFLPRVIEPRGKLERGPLESVRHTFSFFFLWALKEKLVVVLKKKYFKNFTNDTKYDIMMSPRMQSCGFGQSNHVSRINRVIWLVAVVRLKEKEGKNEQHGCMTVLWRRFLLRSKLVFTVCFWGAQAYEGIRYVCLLACWSFWWHRSLHFSPRRRNWRRFVIRFFARCSIIAGSYCP